MTSITPLCVFLQIRVVVSTIFTFQVFNSHHHHHRNLIREKERYLVKQTLKASRPTNTDLQPEISDHSLCHTESRSRSVGKHLILLYASTSFTLDRISCVLGGINFKRSGELMGAVVQLS